MSWLIFSLILLLLILSYLLFAPFYLVIDSESNMIRFKFYNIASLTFPYSEIPFILKLKIVGWIKQIKLSGNRSDKALPESKKRKKQFPKLSINKTKAILKSFKINHFRIDLDLGDVQWNGLLFPVFYWVGELSNKEININFIGRNTFKIEIENNLARMIRAYVFNK